eukprot:symbB.v1.2.027433.t1/scaffold2815.1/size69651/2
MSTAKISPVRSIAIVLRALAAYAQAWCLYVWVPAIDFLLLDGQGSVDARPLGLGDVFLLPLALAGACLASVAGGKNSLPLLRCAHGIKLLMFFLRMPMVWDHECWAALTEVSFLVTCQTTEATSISRFWSLARAQLLLLYASAAWWKLNTSFLDPRTSCGTVILVQLLSTYVPEALAEEVAPLVVRMAPILGLLGEASIAFLLWLMPKVGTLSALMFHLLVLMCPAPNFAGGFSTSCAARLMLILPLEAAVHCNALSHWVPLGAALLAALLPSAAAGAYGAFMIMTLQGLLQTTNGGGTGGTGGAWRKVTEGLGFDCVQWVVLMVTFVYAFLLPVLGLQHMASCSMYANLKHYGGSNHLLMPTGLLQDWFHHDLSSAFGGGLLRLDAAAYASMSLNAWTPVEPDLAVRLLRQSGHSGKQFAAYYARLESLEAAGVGSYEPAMPLVMPSYELRRVLRDRQPDGSVRLVRLPQTLRTPKEWWNYRGEQAADCQWAMHLLKPPPWWLTKILLPYPYPLLPDDETEVHCSS